MRRTKKQAKENATSVVKQIKLGTVYESDAISKLDNGTIEALRAVEVVNPKDVEIKSTKRSFHSYNRLTGKQTVTMGMKSLSKDENDSDYFVRVLFHEIAHYIDRKAGKVSRNEKYGKKFKSALWRETKAIIKDYDERMDMNSLARDLKDKQIVSDMISAVYKNKIDVPFYHTGAYWKKDKYHINCEAFAHFFSALFVPRLMKQVERYFPESFKLFMKMLKDIAG